MKTKRIVTLIMANTQIVTTSWSGDRINVDHMSFTKGFKDITSKTKISV